MTFSTDWINTNSADLDHEIRQAALRHQDQLTKPQGALGVLEALAVRLAAMQRSLTPNVDVVHISIFAGDHGVALEGISAFPQAVTVEMLRNFASGGAAISVLATELGAQLEIINVGTVQDPGLIPGVLDARVGCGTENLARAPAMSLTQVAQALDIGRLAVERARQGGAELFIGGDMGIGNTTSAAAMACALLGATPVELAGAGTGLDSNGIQHKVNIITQALALHAADLDSPLEILRHLGGFEIAALTGAYLACAKNGIPVLVDGFICAAAALCAVRLHPATREWLLFSHCSAEQGHRRILEALNAQPVLNLGMRLGEASGAAVALPLLRLACALHNNMATFADAQIQEALA